MSEQPKADPVECERRRAEAMDKLRKMPLGGNLVGTLRAIRAARAIQAGYDPETGRAFTESG